MDAVLILCIIMTVIFLAMPLVILILGLKNQQMPILKVAVIWLVVNILLVAALWILYGAVLAPMAINA